jgi:hypothetical protein
VRPRQLWLLFPAFCVAVALWWDNGGQGWLSVQTGTRCGSSGPHYCYWSGFGSVWPFSAFVFIPVITAGLLLWRSHTCHYSWWCWRRPVHPLEGNEHYLLCFRHHPDEHMTIHEAIAHHIRLRRARKTRQV